MCFEILLSRIGPFVRVHWYEIFTVTISIYLLKYNKDKQVIVNFQFDFSFNKKKWYLTFYISLKSTNFNF